jgi:hypothetical protein
VGTISVVIVGGTPILWLGLMVALL